MRYRLGESFSRSDFLANDGRYVEAIAILASKLRTTRTEAFQPIGVHELNQAAGPGRRAKGIGGLFDLNFMKRR